MSEWTGISGDNWPEMQTRRLNKDQGSKNTGALLPTCGQQRWLFFYHNPHLLLFPGAPPAVRADGTGGSGWGEQRGSQQLPASLQASSSMLVSPLDRRQRKKSGTDVN